MTNAVQAETYAVQELERMLEASGWSDGWGMGDKEIAEAPNPLFYRNSTPAAAADAKVKAEGQTHSLYLVFNVVGTETKYADNIPSNFDVTLALTFYYDEPYLFHETAEAVSPFKGFIEGLLSELSEGLWTISSEGESVVAAAGDRGPYTNRKVLFVKNNF